MTEDELRKKTTAHGNIDKLIHEPARLLILSYLSLLESADFLFLKAETELSWGNLSVHMSKLEEAGYVTIEKEIKRKKLHTIASLTPKGRTAFEKYKKNIDNLLK